MIRHTLLLIAWLAAACLAISTAAHANTFSATYAELARSPANYAASWYSGAVTKDGKFVYGLGHSHNSNGNNGLWLYDPATNTHMVRPSSDPRTTSYAALYDPAAQQWTKLAIGEGWGNTGMVHSSGKLILMGGGINGPEYHNKQVWIGTLSAD